MEFRECEHVKGCRIAWGVGCMSTSLLVIGSL